MSLLFAPLSLRDVTFSVDNRSILPPLTLEIPMDGQVLGLIGHGGITSFGRGGGPGLSHPVHGGQRGQRCLYLNKRPSFCKPMAKGQRPAVLPVAIRVLPGLGKRPSTGKGRFARLPRDSGRDRTGFGRTRIGRA